ncbi:MAG: ATP-binding protein [Anaerolineae bacterium]
MTPEGIPQQGATAIKQLNREDLRQSTAQATALALALASLVGVMDWVARGYPPTLFYWLVLAGIAVLSLIALGCHRLSIDKPRLAGVVLVATMFAAVVTAFLALRVYQAAFFLVVPVLFTAALFRPALAGIVAVMALVIIRVGPLDQQAWLAPSMLTTASVGTAWLILRPLYRVLEWSWQRSAEAIRVAEELQEQRGKLNRTMKALDLTNRLLQRTNHELALARQEAEKARHLKEEFAASISHELRTPLNIILGFAEIMHSSPEVYGDFTWPRALQRDIAEIQRNAGYISSLLDDILDLARVEAMRMPVRREPADLAEVIEEAAQLARQLLRDRPVSLDIAVPPGLPKLSLDRTRIRQVLLNLLSNASRYTERGSIRVSASLGEEEVVVAVADTGAGIPADELESIFDEYHQVDVWRRPGQGGKGLGLAVAKRFVQLHAGRIWAESELGRGSTFYFTIPLARKDFSRLGQATPAPLPANPYAPCLLLLDGDESGAAYLRRHLDGYSIVSTDKAERLIELAESHHPSAIIVNALPANGNVVTLEQLPPGVPAVVCALPQAQRPPAEGRFQGVLSKPVSSETLLLALRKLLASGDVLVVDDDRGFVQFVARLLQTAGGAYQVRWAYNGREALRKMQAQQPDLLLLDMMMPEMSGPALAEAMRASPELAEIPILAITGASFEEPGRCTPGTSLTLVKRQGLREGEVLGILRSIPQLVRADYVTEAGTPAMLSATAANRPG